jgi:hypothetical protein
LRTKPIWQTFRDCPIRAFAEIPYPHDPEKPREPEVQLWLWNALRQQLHWDAHLEVLPAKTKGKGFDIVVYKDKKAVRIIEVKGFDPLDGSQVTDTGDEFVCMHKGSKAEKQLNRYRAFGLPVDYILGMQRAQEYLEWARRRGRPEW